MPAALVENIRFSANLYSGFHIDLKEQRIPQLIFVEFSILHEHAHLKTRTNIVFLVKNMNKKSH